MARITPADSWPRMCVSVTTMGPIRPACQKWMSDLLFKLEISRRLLVKEAGTLNVGSVPAYPGALDSNCDFTMLQVLSFLDAIECRS